MECRGERLLRIAVRSFLGVGAFAWGALVFFSSFHKSPYWLIVGAVLGGAATIVTRDAGRRSLGRFLAALGYVSLGVIGVVLLQPSDGCVVAQIPFSRSVVPLEKFLAVTMLPIPLWLFLSSRAGRRGSR